MMQITGVMMIKYFINGLEIKGGKKQYDFASDKYPDIAFRIKGDDLDVVTLQSIKNHACSGEFVSVKIIDGAMNIYFYAMLELGDDVIFYGQSTGKVEVLIGGHDMNKGFVAK